MANSSRPIVHLSKEQICEINRRMIGEFSGVFIEPSNLMNEGSLDYVLELVSTAPFGIAPYPEVHDKAAAMCVHIITRHVFNDGNKRTGGHVAWEFLQANGYNVDLDPTYIQLLEGVAANRLEDDDVRDWLLSHSQRRATP